MKNKITAYISHNSRDLTIHDDRVQFLNTLAILLGCRESFGGQFPDGRRPDVLRMNSKQNILFIGDAKHSESPRYKATQSRLMEYFRWLSAYMVRERSIGIFAICFGRESDTQGWIETISLLGQEVALKSTEQGVEKFEPSLVVAWFTFRNARYLSS